MWRENARKVVLLFSGGVESSCLLYHYLMEGWLVYPLYIKAGYPWEKLELENATELWFFVKKSYKNLMPIRVLSLTNPEGIEKRKHDKDLYIPIRNLSLITSASLYALRKDIKNIAIGSLGIYPFPDNNAEYFQKLEELTGLKLLTPFMGMRKQEVIRKFHKVLPIERTLSCINPKKIRKKIKACGSCEKCKERDRALSSK